MAIVIDSRHVSSPVLDRCSATVVLGRPSLRGFRNGVGPNNVLVCSKCKVVRPPAHGSVRVCHVSTVSTTGRGKVTGAFGVVILKNLLGLHPMMSVRDMVGTLHGALPRHRRRLVPVGRRTVQVKVRVVGPRWIGVALGRWWGRRLSVTRGLFLLFLCYVFTTIVGEVFSVVFLLFLYFRASLVTRQAVGALGGRFNSSTGKLSEGRCSHGKGPVSAATMMSTDAVPVKLCS